MTKILGMQNRVDTQKLITVNNKGEKSCDHLYILEKGFHNIQ